MLLLNYRVIDVMTYQAKGTKTMTQTKKDTHSEDQAKTQLLSIIEIMTQWTKAITKAIDEDNQDKLEQLETEIFESPLSIMIRDGWRTPGVMTEEGAEEYEILLCTGGPAVKIVGEISQFGEPDTAIIQHQDWGTPWIDLFTTTEEDTYLLEYTQRFYFGD